MAPPRGRGWTRRALLAATEAGGSPAWAGMDPRRLGRRPPRRRLPRVGGDGPLATVAADLVRLAPPRGRGWTPERERIEVAGAGSPAWAGMDPRRARTSAPQGGLPRVGGDGPAGVVTIARGQEAPPRGRGWTRASTASRSAAGGSPAWAGMDPPRRTRGAQHRRLPRVGGDGPEADHALACACAAPPRGRGWTRPRPHRPPPHRGSPAWAGMDPRARAHRGRRGWLPRVGGDGPSARMALRTLFQAPPRGRGWTLAELLARVNELGSPAWAGMDPST